MGTKKKKKCYFLYRCRRGACGALSSGFSAAMGSSRCRSPPASERERRSRGRRESGGAFSEQRRRERESASQERRSEREGEEKRPRPTTEISAHTFFSFPISIHISSRLHPSLPCSTLSFLPSSSLLLLPPHQRMAHWSVLPLAIVGTVAFSLWIATCCFGEEKLRALLGRRSAETAAADNLALPGRGADRPTSDLLADLERS